MRIDVRPGDCLETMARMIADSVQVDSICTDPPYHLTSIVKRYGANDAAPNQQGTDGRFARATAGFMGQRWDGGDIAFRPETWRLCFDLMKPGAHLVAFAGIRTYHRIACAIEDAGFEIRDQFGWCYGTGFPKSHDVSKGIDKLRGAKRKVVAEQKPVKRMIPGADQAKDGWEKNNGREFVPTITVAGSAEAAAWEGWGTAVKPAWEPICLARKPLSEPSVAANVLKHGTGAINIDGCRISVDDDSYERNCSADRGHDENRGRQSAYGITAGRASKIGRWPANIIHDGSDEVLAAFPSDAGAFAPVRGTEPSDAIANVYSARERVATHHHGDTGSAARFFYSAKADADDRFGSRHPTVKPIDLMRWLTRLITPPGGLVLDPFAGSGTTGVACLAEGFRAILCEREEQYLADIRERLDFYAGEGKHSMATKNRAKTAKPIGGLFG